MRIRATIELIAFGSVFRGFSVSAAAVPTISTPMNEKMPIWKPSTKPLAPMGNMPPWLQRFEIEATSPTGFWKRVAIRKIPTPIRPRIATILMIANQNSVSPKVFTLTRLIALISTKNAAAVAQVGMSGYQYCTYLPTAVSSAMPTST